MSNPYDPYQPSDSSGDQPSSPYGTPPPAPGAPYGAQPGGGQPPYGGAGFNPYGAPQGQPAKTDAVSIISFVLSLTCCLSVVGFILGFFGLKRTKGGQRKGRWASIAGLIVGGLGTIAFVAIIIGVVFLAKHTITIDSAKVGECMNVSTDSDNKVTLFKKSCTSSHDAEIVYKGDKGSIPTNLVPKSINDLSDTGIADAVCSSLVPASTKASIDTNTYDYGIASADPSSTKSTDQFICYVQRSDGAKISSDLLK